MDAQQKLKALLDQLNTVIVGKPAQVQDCVACLLAGGHLGDTQAFHCWWFMLVVTLAHNADAA